ncbi:MAG TPA: ABC transporter permease [Candidatus Bathyarchaeia archaeon]|nr:ABC transporter permease [Candidatus Bathyarchaeia archaeon]
MDLAEAIKVALESLKANKMRSFLTMLGIIIGVASVILLISIGSGLQTYITQQLEGLGANALFVIPGEFEIGEGGGGGVPGAGAAASKFTFDHINDLEGQSRTIKAVMAYTENNGTMRYKGNTLITQVTGVSPNYQAVRDQKVVEGSFFTTSQYNSAKKVAVLGKTVAEDLFGQEDPIGKKMTISDQRYTVMGILEEKGSFGGVDMDNQVFIPATTSLRQFEMEYIQSLWVQSESSELVPETKKEIEKILARTLDDDEFSVLDTKSILSVVSSILGVLTAALGGIAAISLIVGGIGIMNIMLVSVTERTREVGLRKAVGATPQNILIQFLIEAVVISFVGGLIGVFLGVSFSLLIGRFFTTTVSPWAIGLAFGVSAVVGIVFGVAPAAKASRLNPIDALRYE